MKMFDSKLRILVTREELGKVIRYPLRKYSLEEISEKTGKSIEWLKELLEETEK